MSTTAESSRATATAPATDRRLRAVTSREALQRATSLVFPARSKVLPLVQIAAAAEGLTFACDNGAVAIRHTIPAGEAVSDLQPGALCVNIEQLRALATELAPGQVQLAMTAADRLTLTNGEHAARFVGMPDDALLMMPEGAASNFGLRAGVLQSHINKVAYAAADKKENKPILEGVLLEIRPSRVTFTAASGHRASTLTVKTKVAEGPKLDLILPTAGLEAIAASFAAEEEVTCAVRAEPGASPTHLTVRSATTAVTIALIAGEYPDYRRALPANYPTTATLDRYALMSAVRRVQVMAGDGSHRVRLQFRADMALIDSATPDRGDADDKVPCSLEGTPLTLGINAGFLLDALRRVSTAQVALSLKSEELAVGIAPVYPSDAPARDVSSFVQVVMPLRLNVA